MKAQSGISALSQFQGNLQKLCNNIILGYQNKHWKILQNGTKIGYRNIKQSGFKDQCVFDIKQVSTKEAQQQKVFILVTEKRSYTLRAPSQETKDKWMKVIVMLKKQLEKKHQSPVKGKLIMKKQISTTQETLPSTSYLNNPQSNKKLPQNYQAETLKKPKNKQTGKEIVIDKIKTEKKKKQGQKGKTPNKILHNLAQKQYTKTIKPPKPSSETKSDIKTVKSPGKQQRTVSKVSQSSKRKQSNYSGTRKTSGVPQPQMNPKEMLNFLRRFQKSQNFLKLPDQLLIYNIFKIKIATEIYSPSVLNVLNSFQPGQVSYIIFSSKSLFPDKAQIDQNLLSVMLPSYCQVDTLYKIIQIQYQQGNEKRLKYKMQQVFKMQKVIQIMQKDGQGTLKVNIGQEISVFQFKTVQQKRIFKTILDTAILNWRQSTISEKLFKNSKMRDQTNKTSRKFKRNYDRLINLHQTNKDIFDSELSLLLGRYFPQKPTYQFDQFTDLIKKVKVFLIQLIVIFQHKVQPKNHVVQSVLHRIHEDIKIHIKLTWDTAHGRVNGLEILKILQGISQYTEAIKEYIKDNEINDGLKELSKIYVRQAWGNFQNIIIGIVQLQKNTDAQSLKKIKQDDDAPTTSGVTDLFRFVYDVFDLASPHWQHKLHLHNVNRLMARALSVFVHQLKATVDEYVIDYKVLAAISNNYFNFSEMVDDFYQEKFSQLKDKTKDSYQKVVREYRELSLIILDKISNQSIISVRRFFASAQFSNFDSEKLFKLILNDTREISSFLHRVFCKKFFQRILQTVKQQIIRTLCNSESTAIESKKKAKAPIAKSSTSLEPVTPSIKAIIQRIRAVQADLIQIFTNLAKEKITPRNFSQFHDLLIILSSTRLEQIIGVLKGTSQPFKQLFQSLICLRNDYYQGSLIAQKMNNPDNYKNNQNQSKRINYAINAQRKQSKPRKLSDQQNFTGSLSKYYMDNESISEKSDISGRSRSAKSKNQGQTKLISEGYLGKAKLNKTIWERIYIRMKRGTIYIYSDENATVSINSFKIQQIISCLTSENEKCSFIINYKNLNRNKQIHLKAETGELRQRWMQSIDLQRKRVKNDEQVKRKAMKMSNTGKGKNYQLIIDFEEAVLGKGYFSYS